MKEFGFLNTIREKWQIMFWLTLLSVVLSFVITIVQPPKYRSSFQILIAQRYGANTDIYAASKFTEYLSNLLNEVIYSKSFFDQVMNSGFGIKKEFSAKAEKRARQWKRIVQSKIISNTGIISVDIYNRNREQADKLANAVAFVLVAKSDQYHGAGQQVIVKLIDGPVTTDRTVKPSIILNLIIGLILGLILSVTFLYLFPGFDFSRSFKVAENYSLNYPLGQTKALSQSVIGDRKDFGQDVYQSDKN